MALEEYRRKREFAKTPEPIGGEPDDGVNQWRFVVQKHDASRLHYDLRLELDGVLLSWAIPKGPSLDWANKRLAVHVEDHPLEYLDFEGVIPLHEYGGGTVMVWDIGHWTPRDDARKDYTAGALKFDLQGKKLTGGWMLKRTNREGENQWLLIKEKDIAMRETADFEVLRELPNSAISGRTMTEIATDKDAVWNRGPTTEFRPDLTSLTKAKRRPISRVIKPCLPTATRHAPRGEQWIHEIKYDGYRMLCKAEDGDVKFFSRSGRDWTGKLRSLSRWMRALPVESAILDGEVVMMNADGVSNFQALQNRIGAGSDHELRYYAFDLLYLNGHDVTGMPLLNRKEILSDLVQASGLEQRFIFSEHLVGDGPTIFKQACTLGVEGIVSKRIDKRYSSGRFEFWLKTKCLLSREFVIGGFTMPTASRIGIGAILLGVPTDDGLHFVGKVGTGFSHETLVHLRRLLEPEKVSTSPFLNLDAKKADKGTVWVTPVNIAEIEFGGWTDEGLIRFGAFRGLRDDLEMEELSQSLPANGEPELAVESSAAPSPADVHPEARLELPDELSQVRISNPHRVV